MIPLQPQVEGEKNKTCSAPQRRGGGGLSWGLEAQSIVTSLGVYYEVIFLSYQHPRANVCCSCTVSNYCLLCYHDAPPLGPALQTNCRCPPNFKCPLALLFVCNPARNPFDLQHGICIHFTSSLCHTHQSEYFLPSGGQKHTFVRLKQRKRNNTRTKYWLLSLIVYNYIAWNVGMRTNLLPDALLRCGWLETTIGLYYIFYV